MKILTLFLFILLAGNPSLIEIRNGFEKAAESSVSAHELAEKLEGVEKSDSKVLLAYKGATKTLLARFTKKIEEKKLNFKEGVELIEYSVAHASNDVEIRFIRLCIQENTPPFLKYKMNIEEDKELILEQFSNMKSADLKQRIQDYILNSKAFSETEKQKIK